MQADVLALEHDDRDRIKVNPRFQSVDERLEDIVQIQMCACRLRDVEDELSAGLENITRHRGHGHIGKGTTALDIRTYGARTSSRPAEPRRVERLCGAESYGRLDSRDDDNLRRGVFPLGKGTNILDRPSRGA